MEAQAANLTNEHSRGRNPSAWLSWYIRGIIALGIVAALLSLLDLPDDRIGLLTFGLLAAAAQLADVELFASSRARISVSNVLAIASILLFGPMAGAQTHLFSGVMTAITTTLRSSQPEQGRASWLLRSAFNTSMLVISTAVAGWVYVLLGGTVGSINQPGNILPLICAASVDSLGNLAILLWVVALQTGRNPLDIWRQDLSWGLPVNILAGILGGGALAIAYQGQRLLGVLVFLFPIAAISYAFRLYVSRMKGVVDELQEIRRSQSAQIEDLLETLSALIDAKDRFTYEHSKGVVKYAVALAEKMGLTPEELEVLRKAALVHDIGKVGIADEVIGKPGKLSPEEYSLVKRHPAIGADVIGRISGLQALVPLVRHHHERWDGGGYPDGLKGDEIPVPVRILSLADALEAMLTDRPHRAAPLSFQEILAEVQRCSGTQFDPQVVAAFLALAEEKDLTFFVNSAALLDRAALLSGVDAGTTHRRYLKKGVLE
jgi:putative nucleotidyltransferase with HDIG domain